MPATTIVATTTATRPSADPVPRTASESGGRTISVRLWALPMNASPNPRRSGATSPGTRDRAAGNVIAIPIPWLTRATTNGTRSVAGSRPGNSSTPAPMRYATRTGRKEPQAPEPVDKRSPDERGGHLDEGGQADDQPDLAVRHAGPGKGDGQRGREAVEPGLEREQCDGDPERASANHRRARACMRASYGPPAPPRGLRRGTARGHPSFMVRRHRRPVSRHLPRSTAFAGILASLILAATAGPAAAGDFPPRDGAYHNFTEMVADIKAVEAAHPGHRRRLQDRQELPGPDDLGGEDQRQRRDRRGSEPEILFDALHHAREHMTVEQALYLLHLLADNYGSDTQITNLVNNREIWIVFAVNPDGFEYDLTCSGAHAPYCAWRKNRQPNSGPSTSART